LDHLGLSQAWADQPVWRILDTRFDPGLRFLSVWQAWRSDPQRPRVLHYVALTPSAPDLQALLALVNSEPHLEPLVPDLTRQWFGLLPGFHRLMFEGGQVMLTLCVGETLAMLRDQQFHADSIFLDPGPEGGSCWNNWNIWTTKALARCSRRGTHLVVRSPDPERRADLLQCGFVPNADGTTAAAITRLEHFQYQPRWVIQHSRSRLGQAIAEPGTCVVVGAGVAGASVASALARRGWQVQVLDQADAPASGASGLPVGLVVPHVSGDDCALSRLSRAGVRLMLHQARTLLQAGLDWDQTGTLERCLEGITTLPHADSASAQEWTEIVSGQSHPRWADVLQPGDPALWHTQAAWLKPAQLIRAWLRQPGIRFKGGSQVAVLRQEAGQWELLDAHGQLLARAQRVVLANAMDARRLVAQLHPQLAPHPGRERQMAALHGMHGQLSWGRHVDTDAKEDKASFAPYPVNGAGSLVAQVPTATGPAWFVGSSYTPDRQPLPSVAQLHAYNLQRLQRIQPQTARVLATQFNAGEVNAWTNTRCVTLDRLPLVGPLDEEAQSGVWMCAGMGSRGLSLSVLCAELLAAQWGGEPLPLDATLAASLQALRGG
jgi:tRNA 5-methylaminomethyl-2-thiouridine biosynthesis bifunctional protein